MPPLISNNHGKAATGSGGNGGGFEWSKNFITEQDWIAVFQLLNGSSWGFDAVEGLGTEVASSTVVLLPGSTPDGNADMEIVSEFAAPDAVFEGGIMARMTGFNTPNANYYWARITGGEARIVKVVGGTATTLDSDTFGHVAGDVFNVTLTVQGDQLSATFENITNPNTVNLSSTDSDIADPGVAGLRTGFTDSEVWWRTVSVRTL